MLANASSLRALHQPAECGAGDVQPDQATELININTPSDAELFQALSFRPTNPSNDNGIDRV